MKDKLTYKLCADFGLTTSDEQFVKLKNLTAIISEKSNQLLTNFGANFKQLCLERAAWLRITLRLKEIKKRRALFGNQTVELLINSAGKRTVVHLNPCFFYFFNPFFVSGHASSSLC